MSGLTCGHVDAGVELVADHGAHAVGERLGEVGVAHRDAEVALADVEPVPRRPRVRADLRRREQVPHDVAQVPRHAAPPQSLERGSIEDRLGSGLPGRGSLGW
jgi:hypothetical protein